MDRKRPRGAFRRMIGTVAMIGALAGCAGDPALEPVPERVGAVPEATPVTAQTVPFDRSVADALVARADALPAGQALPLYREAGEAWPGNRAAWIGMARAAAAAEAQTLRQAATFMVERTALYGDVDVVLLRQVVPSLRAYADRAATDPAIPPLQVAYARLLASYYEAVYRAGGAYTPPERAFLNVEGRELPAVVGTGAAAAAWGALLFSTQN